MSGGAAENVLVVAQIAGINVGQKLLPNCPWCCWGSAGRSCCCRPHTAERRCRSAEDCKRTWRSARCRAGRDHRQDQSQQNGDDAHHDGRASIRVKPRDRAGERRTCLDRPAMGKPFQGLCSASLVAQLTLRVARRDPCPTLIQRNALRHSLSQTRGRAQAVRHMWHLLIRQPASGGLQLSRPTRKPII